MTKDLASVIDLYASERLPYEHMESRVVAEPERATEIIRSLLVTESHGWKVMKLAQALRCTGTAGAISLLLDLIERRNNDLYERYLADAMKESRDRTSPAWMDVRRRGIDLLLRPESLRRIVGCRIVQAMPGTDAIPALLSCLATPDRSLQWAVIDAIEAIGEPNTIPALEAIFEGGQYNRWQAFRAIMTMAGPRRTEFIHRGLQDPDEIIQERAVTALARQPEPGFADPLLALLHKTIGPKFKSLGMKVIEAVAATGDSGAADVFMRLFPTAHEHFRAILCLGLGTLRSRAAVGFLLDKIDDPDHRVSDGARTALGRIGDPSALPTLLAASRSWELGQALAAIGGAAVMAAIAQWLDDENHAEFAIDVLYHMDDQQAVDRLLDQLDRPATRLLAATALIGHPHPQAWRSALRVAATAPTEWREVTDNGLCGIFYARLGSGPRDERRKALADLPPSPVMPPTDDPDAWSTFLTGTWTEVDDNTARHIFTADEKWYLYDGDGELVHEGTWQESHDGTVGLWNGISFPTLTRQRHGVVINDPENDGPITLKRLSDSTDLPPVS